jgi:hypothetical protein
VDDVYVETDLYVKSGKLIEFLSGWSPTGDSFVKRVEELYIALFERGYLESIDVKLTQLWLHELVQSSYILPKIRPKFTLAVRTYAGHIHKMNSR